MCDWQKEQDRLWKLWEEYEDVEPYVDEEDSEEEQENDHLSINSDYPDQEQEAGDEGQRYVQEQDEEEERERAREGKMKTRFFVGKNGSKWSKETPNKNVRTRADNIIIHLPGVKTYGKSAKTPIECFQLFIDEEMTADIVRNTTIVEMKALFGLLYLAGVFKNNHRNLHELWNTDGTGMDIFRCAMSQTRSEFLVSCLRFDNKGNRQERLKKTN
uniref:PiggyBac transposable element-derived protein n=1 Tax=Anoplophora glabripennis TaxID=217634 RepID=V5GVF1_ANOGL